ncbi:hypothetical protein [Gracilibacillus phocaeensis]|uniref:hypothetical protein n=1 Tax=Gracilibacillus phocaeensis TaxID=2042304 RepID=UPI0010305A66|nr:hypothetical protein [Gracilibacillus phocaeensis]
MNLQEKTGLSNKVCKFPFTQGTLTLYLSVHHEEEALLRYPEIPEDFYNLYFNSWSEVLAAVRVNGMNENRVIESEYKGIKSKRRVTEQMELDL